MANSIVGALYLGLLTAGASPHMPADGLAARALPTPQCVVCGPANRHTVASVYDWSNGRVTVRRGVLAEMLSEARARELMSAMRLGIAEEPVQRMATYAGA